MNKSEIIPLNNNQNNNSCLKIINDITPKNTYSQKYSNISSNKNTLKNKSVSSNHILNTFGDETKSKNTFNNIKTKKNEVPKNKKKKNNKDKKNNKLISFLKNNQKEKIPRAKRLSIAGNSNMLDNFNNLLNLNSLTPPKTPQKSQTKELNIRNARRDKNGIEINKNNKKKVHITFLDDISPDNKITETINIQSFKQFNIVEKFPVDRNISNLSKCCNIF